MLKTLVIFRHSVISKVVQSIVTAIYVFQHKSVSPRNKTNIIQTFEVVSAVAALAVEAGC